MTRILNPPVKSPPQGYFYSPNKMEVLLIGSLGSAPISLCPNALPHEAPGQHGEGRGLVLKSVLKSEACTQPRRGLSLREQLITPDQPYRFVRPNIG